VWQKQSTESERSEPNHDVGTCSTALESTDHVEARSGMCGSGISRWGSQSHKSLQPTLPYRFEKKLTGQRRSPEISGLLASRARNVADTF
jgi:hypothetical protein